MCVLSELLVCCGHPQQHRSDTAASTCLNRASSLFTLRVCVCMRVHVCACVRVCVCVVLLVFGIATASSPGASPPPHAYPFIVKYLSVFSSPTLLLSLSPIALPLSPSSPTVYRSRRSGIIMHACGAVLNGYSFRSDRKTQGGRNDWRYSECFLLTKEKKKAKPICS